MKLYISQDGQTLGPYAEEEIRHKVYSGEVQRSALACADGSTEWRSLESFLMPEAVAKQVEAAPAADLLNQLHDPKEKSSLMWLYIASVPAWLIVLTLVAVTFGAILIFFGIYWLFVAFGEMWFGAYLKTNAVRVSERQLPELHRVVLAGSRKLMMDCPDVYVLQQNVWNAFATKIFGRRMIVLLSGAVDSILLKGDEQQLAWLVGHELGHHWAGHLDLSQKLAKAGNLVVWVGLWHSRRAELTCDRVGLYCSGSLKASQLALINATVGAQLASRVDPEAAVEQWQMHRNEFFVRYRTLYSSSPHLLARLDYLNQAAAELGIKA